MLSKPCCVCSIFLFLGATLMTVSLAVPSNLYPQRWTLSSPPFFTTTPACLNLTFTARAYFAVHLSCISKNGTYVDRLLYRVNELFVPDLNYIPDDLSVLCISIDPTSSRYAQCAWVFETSSFQAGDLAVISSVQLIPEKCQQTYGN